MADKCKIKIRLTPQWMFKKYPSNVVSRTKEKYEIVYGCRVIARVPTRSEAMRRIKKLINIRDECLNE